MQAHAWVEAYLEGYGWIPFEPTTCFSGSFYDVENYTGVFTPDFIREYGDSEYFSNLQAFNQDLKTEPVKKENMSILILYISIITIISLFILFISLMVINIIRIQLKFNRYKNMDNRDSVVSVYNYYHDSGWGNGLFPYDKTAAPARERTRPDGTGPG